ncbi:MAG: AAA family ATPase [Paraglaciecola sp.]|uniref:AAA family ATPase n=1 Tax=Paraglaciecola sp. TaxID=1920173 RepID=UPI003273A072
MYLESLTIENYRKFGTKDNTIHFVKPEIIDTSTEEGQQKPVIAPSTTLIIGKNNSGKTTVVNALNMLCQNKQPSASDFNLSYLNGLFNEYKQAFSANKKTKFENLETPTLKFSLRFKVDFKSKDSMTHLSPFISISEKDSGKPVSVRILVKTTLAEESIFKEEVSKIFNSSDKVEKFEMFYALLSRDTSDLQVEGNLYETQFKDDRERLAEKFSLKKFINIKEIKANRHLKKDVLSSVFNKIVEFQFSNDKDSSLKLTRSINTINEQISSDVGSKSEDISSVLSEIENTNQVDLKLLGNVTYDAIMKGLIKYNFMDGDDYIPEDQFGLGYINLLNIIGEIIHFVDSYEDKSHLSCINLLFIEEPEAFMHPQMQEFFIKRIDNAVTKALEIANGSSSDKKILQCQIAITTHSSHIVNSKIHSSNTFNNLNYLTSIKKNVKAINLTDEAVVSNKGDKKNKNLNFIKKHIKYKVSELFFSDAIIFVEGITEETLLDYYLENHPVLNNYYISVFNINGAHGKLYLPLIKNLSIPSLIVTDVDIKREKCEQGKKHTKSEDIKKCSKCGYQKETESSSFVAGSSPQYSQINSLNGRTTTNSTLVEFNQILKDKGENVAKQLDDIEYFEDESLYVVFQKEPIEGQYATSLEEALILTNYKNDIVNDVIKECKPEIYKEMLNSSGKESRENLINYSYKLQKKLSNSKSEFSNKLLFSLLSAEDDADLPQLPNYLIDGLDWLITKLQSNDEPSSSDTIADVGVEHTTVENTEATSDDEK